MKAKLATLRVCCNCEWIFTMNTQEDVECPKCKFGSYGARCVYGTKAYYYAKTQKPWFEKKMDIYSESLYKEIKRGLRL